MGKGMKYIEENDNFPTDNKTCGVGKKLYV